MELGPLEQEWLKGLPDIELSCLPETLDQVMLADDRYWRNYYRGDIHKTRLARRYSYSDRLRYYWTYPEVKAALDRLLVNLNYAPIPASLVSQFLPEQHARIQGGLLTANPVSMIEDKIVALLTIYEAACN